MDAKKKFSPRAASPKGGKGTKRSSKRRKKKSKISARWHPENDVKKAPKKEMSMMLQNLSGAVAKKKEDLAHAPEHLPEKKVVKVGKIDANAAIPEEKPMERKEVNVGKLVIDENMESETPPPQKRVVSVGKIDKEKVEKEIEQSGHAVVKQEEVGPAGRIDMNGVMKQPEKAPVSTVEEDIDFDFEQEEIIVDDNRIIPDKKKGVYYEEDVYIDDIWLKEAVKAEKEGHHLKEYLEPYTRAKYIIFEFAHWEGDTDMFNDVLGTYANMTFQVAGMYFFHVGNGLGHSSAFIRHCREFIAMNHLTIEELVFNTVGNCMKMFLWMPICPKLEMVTFSAVELDPAVFKMLARQPNVKHLVISGGHDNDFETEKFFLSFIKAVGKRLVTLGIEDPHFESSVAFFDKLLHSCPKLRVFGAKDWIGGQKKFVQDMHDSHEHRMTELKPRALGELFTKENFRWWEYADGFKVKVLAEGKH